MTLTNQNVPQVGKVTRQRRQRLNADVLALVWNQARDGDNERRVSHSPPPAQRAGVTRRMEANRIRSQIERRNRRRFFDADLTHDIRRELRHPLRRADDSRRSTEYRACSAPLERASLRFLSLAEQIATVHINEIGNVELAVRPRYGIAHWTNVAAVKHIEHGRAVGHQPARPSHLVREPVRAVERKGLAINPVRLVWIELAGLRGRNGGNAHHSLFFHSVRESPAQLHVSSCHSAEVWRVVLRYEEMVQTP